MKHTAPAVSQFIIWKLHSYIIFFKCQLMFSRKGRHLLYEMLRCFNLLFFPSLSLSPALSLPTLPTWEQYSIILSASCQGEAHLLQDANFNPQQAKHSAALGYRFNPNRQPPIPHYAPHRTDDNHQHFS